MANEDKDLEFLLNDQLFVSMVLVSLCSFDIVPQLKLKKVSFEIYKNSTKYNRNEGIDHLNVW